MKLSTDFPEISRQVRESVNWSCSECKVDMLKMKKGLHVHHINGLKYDNSKNNLKVLCALCHQNIDEFHKTMHVPKEVERFINKNRSQ